MEIGSEFWIDKDYIVDPLEQFYMSGRSALNAIVLDVKKKYAVEQVLMPSYCCDSMIVPFIKNQIRIRFYDVYLDNDHKISVEIPKAEKNEVLFLMHYFGAKVRKFHIQGEFRDWITVIEDKTHSFFSSFDSDIDSEYEFVSFRKWFAVSGIAMAKNTDRSLIVPDATNNKFLALRNEAFFEKARYISGAQINKDLFLNKFRKAEEILDIDSMCYLPDRKDYYRLTQRLHQKEALVQARRANAAVLIKELQKIPQLSVMVDFDMDMDCPLFVPVAELTGQRDQLRRYLIDNKVYCPVHWPTSSYHGEILVRTQEIYDNELSLVCDQRYSPNEMMKIIETISNYYSGDIV